MPQVASTLATDVKYTLWSPKSKDAPGGPNTAIKHVTIHGGHGVAHRRAHGGLETPNGVLTTVTDEDVELLKKDEVFQTHERNGYVRIIESARKVAPEAAAKDLETKEPSAPLDAEDFKDGGRAQAPKDMKLSLGKGRTK